MQIGYGGLAGANTVLSAPFSMTAGFGGGGRSEPSLLQMKMLQLDLVEVEVDMVPKVQVDHKEIMVLLVVMTLVVEEEE